MCISIKWSEEKTKKWLADRPDIIVAYKLVAISSLYAGKEKRAYPPVYDSEGPYTKNNKQEQQDYTKIVECVGPYKYKDKFKYRPFFHLFLTKKAAKNWAGPRRTEIVLKCEIPKNQITAIGRQNGCVTIITKEFTFVQGDEFFEEYE